MPIQTSDVLAKKCAQHGWAYFHVKYTKDVATTYRLAALNAPALLFVEDIDQTPELNEILNALDADCEGRT